MKKTVLIYLIFSFLAASLVAYISAFPQEKKDFEEPWEKRLNRIQPPEKIMDVIGLKPGMVIGDIGAGSGRYAVWFAERVGETGKVYANDIDIGALLHLSKRCKQLGFKNVITRLGKVTDPNIPEGILDIAFMINVYHHLDDPVGLIKNLIPTLKPEGYLVIVENDPIKSGDTGSHSTSQEDLVDQASQAGYELIKVEAFLTRDNIYFFRPKVNK